MNEKPRRDLPSGTRFAAGIFLGIASAALVSAASFPALGHIADLVVFGAVVAWPKKHA